MVASYPIARKPHREPANPPRISPRELVHIDLYRLGAAEEAELLGLEEYFSPERIVLVEWPERARAALPEDCVEVHIVTTGPDRRRISVGGDRPNHTRSQPGASHPQ